MTADEREKLVDDLIWAARDHERAAYGSSGVDERYTRAELEAERTKVIAALSALQSDAVRAIEELDCLYINGERHPFGGIPADEWSATRRAALQEAIDAIIADQRGASDA